MNGFTRSRWTPKEEAQLAELTERKARIMSENKNLIRSAFAGYDLLPDYEHFIDFCIENAEQIRDALEPFDSGERNVIDVTR